MARQHTGPQTGHDAGNGGEHDGSEPFTPSTGDPGFGEAEINTSQSSTIAIGVQDFISMGMFVPSIDWIHKHVCSQGAGFQRELARLVGIAWGTSRNKTMHGGQELESIRLDGKFQAEGFVTGELMAAPTAYLPPKWAKQVESILLDAKAAGSTDTKVEMDLTIGVRATGKAIPYTWTVTLHVGQDKLDADLMRIASRRTVARPVVLLEGTAQQAAE